MEEITKDPNIGKILDERYELLEVIGVGGMSIVYKAFCHRLNREVAVKIMRTELADNERFRKRFQVESQAIAKLGHPNIVSVYDVSHSDDIEYIVMELLHGVTLKDYLAQNGPLSSGRTVQFALQIAKALDHAHSKGVVHRDIKPQNIMVLAENVVKVADFGIANLQYELPESESEVVGSVHYISPEQARGLPADARSDIYSLGIVMYEMLSGKLPFDGDDDRAIALKHLTAVPESLTELAPKAPKALIDVIMKAMNPSLDERYISSSELVSDLEKLRSSASATYSGIDGNVRPIGTEGELSRESYLRRRRRSKKVSMLSGLFGVVAFILILAVFLWNYWLSDIFSVSQRVSIPNFVGNYYDTIINNKTFSENYNFTLTYEISPDIDKGIITHQSPEAGKIYMLSDKGINVELTISTGVMLTEIPECVNRDYREVITELEKLGFVVDKVFQSSDTVANDQVIEVSPGAGEKLPAGATVYLAISNGPETETIIMPYLINQTLSDAQEIIDSYHLSLVTVSYVYNDTVPDGVVVSQNVSAGTEIAVHSKIYLQVSLGPETTPVADTTVEEEA